MARAVADRAGDKRDLILRAAVRVFARKGYHACRVGDIAAEAGVAHGLLYHYFRSKEDVLETIFRETWGVLREEVARLEASDASALERVRALATVYLGSWTIDPDLIRVLVREVARSPDVGAADRRGRAGLRRDPQDPRVRAGTRRDPGGRGRAARHVGRLRRARGGDDGVGARSPSGHAGGRRARRRHRRGGDRRWTRPRAAPPPAARELVPLQRGVAWSLGLGAFGLAFAITTTTYLQVLLGRFTDSGTLIALVLGSEGLFALALSPVIGPWSDTFHTPLGRRRPFMLVALGPMGFCLALVAFMPSFWTMTLVLLAFFFAYYVYEPPYRGLYPDLLDPQTYGRAQGIQHIMRGIALGAGLVGGGFLLDVLAPVPVPRRRLRDHGGVRRLHRARTRGRRLRGRLRGDARLPQPELARPPRVPRRARVPVRERRVGGSVRCGARLRRQLRGEGPRPAGVRLVDRAGGRRGRVRRRRDRRRPRSATASGSAA